MEKSSKKNFYYEKCIKQSFMANKFFLKKLLKIQSVTKFYQPNCNKFDLIIKHFNSRINIDNNKCKQCCIKKIYKLGNILWCSNIVHMINVHKKYPSDYFIKVITNTCIFNDYIINPPIVISEHQMPYYNYSKLDHNKLLIIDSLMDNGSIPRYILDKNNEKKFLFSEHSGALSVSSDGNIDNVIVSTQTNRIDISDDTIFLPNNTKILSEHMYIFHTHPNTIKYAGRLKNNIIYEFPSAGDIYNFIKYHNEAIAQASIVVAPEGLYVIRPIYYNSKVSTNIDFKYLSTFISKLESIAVKKIMKIKNISHPEIFHKFVSSNFSYLKIYNNFIKKMNLFIEFYPRIKIGEEWFLQQISLVYLDE